MREYQVIAKWDAEAEVFIAHAVDVPGFIVGGFTQDEVVEKVRMHLADFLHTGFDSTDRVRLKFEGQEAERVERLAA